MRYGFGLLSLFLSIPVDGNWLHQCSQCVDQSLYSDMSLKTDIRAANTTFLYDQLKQLQLREFEHVEKEFFNRFFSRTQLGLVAQELQQVSPEAVSLIPERRYTSTNGTQVSSKNVLMVRESHILFTLLGGVQEMSRRVDAMGSDYWARVVEWTKTLSQVQSSIVVIEDAGKDSRTQMAKQVEKINWLDQQWEGSFKLVGLLGDKVNVASSEIAINSREIATTKDIVEQHKNAVSEELMRARVTAEAAQNKFQVEIENIAKSLQMFSENFLNNLNYFKAEYNSFTMSQAETNTIIIANISKIFDDQKQISRRLSMIENDIFTLKSFVYRKQPLIESLSRQRTAEAQVKKFKYLLQLEEAKSSLTKLKNLENLKIANETAKITVQQQEKLASRREEFDKQLVALNEESRLRVLREKNEQERLLAEKQLEFERDKLNVDMAIRIEQARIDSEMKFRDKRENEDVNLRELTERNAAEKERILTVIRETADIIASWIRDLYANPDNLLVGIGSVVALVLGVYLAKEGAQLVREEIARRLGKPDLVRVTSRRGFFEDIIDRILTFLGIRKSLSEADAFKDVVLNLELMTQIKRLAVATKSSRKRSANSPLLNCMFYGEPGTGKTMVAKRFAAFSGLDYAIMSGGDVAPLGGDAVTEIHKLFKWVNSSRRGVVLFIDEAESFLGQRTGGMSENLRNAITALLYHTGTASSKFMMIIATNRPGDLDSAIVDRIDESIEFPLPDVGERERLVSMYHKEYVSKQIEGSISGVLRSVAQLVKGFSGREISKLMMSVHTHLVMGEAESKGGIGEVVLNVTRGKLSEHEKARKMAKEGYQFDHSKLEDKENMNTVN